MHRTPSGARLARARVLRSQLRRLQWSRRARPGAASCVRLTTRRWRIAAKRATRRRRLRPNNPRLRGSHWDGHARCARLATRLALPRAAPVSLRRRAQQSPLRRRRTGPASCARSSTPRRRSTAPRARPSSRRARPLRPSLGRAPRARFSTRRTTASAAHACPSAPAPVLLRRRRRRRRRRVPRLRVLAGPKSCSRRRRRRVPRLRVLAGPKSSSRRWRVAHQRNRLPRPLLLPRPRRRPGLSLLRRWQSPDARAGLGGL